MAATKAKRRPGGGGAAVIIGNEIAAERTATRQQTKLDEFEESPELRRPHWRHGRFPRAVR